MVNNKNNDNSIKSICTILNRRINEIYDALDRGRVFRRIKCSCN